MNGQVVTFGKCEIQIELIFGHWTNETKRNERPNVMNRHLLLLSSVHVFYVQYSMLTRQFIYKIRSFIDRWTKVCWNDSRDETANFPKF
jgi:hypothetical protein